MNTERIDINTNVRSVILIAIGIVIGVAIVIGVVIGRIGHGPSSAPQSVVSRPDQQVAARHFDAASNVLTRGVTRVVQDDVEAVVRVGAKVKTAGLDEVRVNGSLV